MPLLAEKLSLSLCSSSLSWREAGILVRDIKGSAYVCKSKFYFVMKTLLVFLFAFFGMLECCSLHRNQKIAKSVMKLSNSRLQEQLKLSKFRIADIKIVAKLID